MKMLLVLATALCPVMVLGAPALTTAAPAAKNTAAAKPAPATVHAVRHVTAEVVSVNQDAKTLTVKRMMHRRTTESTFVVEPEAVSALADLKPGERVKVRYVASGGKLMAKSIVSGAHMVEK